jgi:hypothetical protein
MLQRQGQERDQTSKTNVCIFVHAFFSNKGAMADNPYHHVPLGSLSFRWHTFIVVYVQFAWAAKNHNT